jgi:hypothetical protein
MRVISDEQGQAATMKILPSPCLRAIFCCVPEILSRAKNLQSPVITLGSRVGITFECICTTMVLTLSGPMVRVKRSVMAEALQARPPMHLGPPESGPQTQRNG